MICLLEENELLVKINDVSNDVKASSSFRPNFVREKSFLGSMLGRGAERKRIYFLCSKSFFFAARSSRIPFPCILFFFEREKMS